MELIKKYKIVILILVPVIILVILRLSGTNHFKPDAKRWAEASISGANIISTEKAATFTGKILIVNLDSDQKSFPAGSEILAVTSGYVLNKDTVKKIRSFKGVVMIYSTDISVSSGIWMMLSQMGIRNIFMLSDDQNNEELKYKFRPDTLS